LEFSTLCNVCRVTRCVCEKVAQNVAQSISFANVYTNLTVEKK
jgi:hypothetical protein